MKKFAGAETRIRKWYRKAIPKTDEGIFCLLQALESISHTETYLLLKAKCPETKNKITLVKKCSADLVEYVGKRLGGTTAYEIQRLYSGWRSGMMHCLELNADSWSRVIRKEIAYMNAYFDKVAL